MRSSWNPPAKSPGWLKIVLQSRPKLEAFVSEILGHPAQLGAVLGCGHWGCVLAVPGTPWVVKISRDPTEGAMWSAIQRLQAEAPNQMQGLARVRAVAQAGIVAWRRGTHPVYVIVREDVLPFAGDVLAPAEIRYLVSSISPATVSQITKDPNPAYVARSLATTASLLTKFKSWATKFHMKRPRRLAGRDIFGLPSPPHPSRERSIEEFWNIAGELQSEPMGYQIGETFSALLDLDPPVVLRDVHLGNVGWRVHARLPGFKDEASTQGLVIYDPGHTPTKGQETIRQLNPRLRHSNPSGDERARRLERDASQGDALAQERVLVEALRRGEPVEVMTTSAGPDQITRGLVVKQQFLTTWNVRGVEIIEARWGFWPNGWPSPELLVEQIHVRRSVAPFFPNVVDLVMREVGRQSPFNAATQHPFRGKVQPL